MEYRAIPAKYVAVEWKGDNVEECRAFFEQWWPQDPPPPEWQTWTPPPAFVHDPETQTLIVKSHGVVNVGDWLVNGGTWVEAGVWNRAPEVVSATLFEAKYAPIP